MALFKMSKVTKDKDMVLYLYLTKQQRKERNLDLGIQSKSIFTKVVICDISIY